MPRHRVDLPDPFLPGGRKLVFVGDLQILIFNIGGTLHAVENSCPHAGGSLAHGKLEGTMLRCPSHGLRFDVTGQGAESGSLAVRCYPVERDEAHIWIVVD